MPCGICRCLGYDSTALQFVVADPKGTREDLHLVQAEGYLRPQQWCHVAGVSGKAGMKLYLDGALVGTNAYTGSFSAFTNGTRNYLGERVTTNDPPSNFKGAMDEVRVWRVARSAEQIRQTILQRLTGREEGLAALWNFDDVTDGVVKDSGPGAHHGKLIGSAKVVAGDTPASLAPTRVSKVLDLDGKESCVELPPNLFSNDVITVEGWVKWRSFGDYSRFFEFSDAALRVGILNLGQPANPAFQRVLNPQYAGQTMSYARGQLVPGQWIHLALVAGTNSSKLFWNGKLLATTPSENNWSPPTPPALKNFLGRSVVKEGGGNPDFDGQMAEVRLWAGERTADEIQSNLFNRLTGREAGLLALWNFADGTARDASPNGRNGTLIGAARIAKETLPTASTLAPWSRLLVRASDSAGLPLPNVDIRAEVDGVEVGTANSDSEGVAPLTVWTTATAVDLFASTTNDFGGWQSAVPIDHYAERPYDWKLGHSVHVAGRAVALDGKTPHANLVVELVKLNAAGGTREERGQVRRAGLGGQESEWRSAPRERYHRQSCIDARRHQQLRRTTAGHLQ